MKKAHVNSSFYIHVVVGQGNGVKLF
jgi:hypothetical protein